MQNLLVALISIPILVVMRWMAIGIPYTNQGFFCDDDEIRYPNRPGTIDSDKMHLLYGLIVFLLVPLSEISLATLHLQGTPLKRNIKYRQVVLKTFLFYATFTCGVLATSVSTNIFKRTSSRLRPNFIAVCKPAELDKLCPFGSNSFVEDFSCLGESRPDEHFSFPSSHASHSLYFATYVILYLHRRFRLPNILRAFVQFLVFVLAVFICLSRVRDFKHRYVDVVGGGMLGMVIGFGMIHLVLFNFRHHRYYIEYSGISKLTISRDAFQSEKTLLRPKYGINSGNDVV